MGNEIVGFGADLGGEVEIGGSNLIIGGCCEVFWLLFWSVVVRFLVKFQDLVQILDNLWLLEGFLVNSGEIPHST